MNAQQTPGSAALRTMLNEDAGSKDPDWPFLAGKRLAIALAAVDALERIEALHVEPYPGAGWCSGCHDGGASDTHPCATLRALSARPAQDSSC